MSAKNHVPVRIRGEVYPSITAAAHAFRVKPSTVSSQLARYGTADGVGLGCKSLRHNSTGHHVKPVTIHGAAFPTIKAASDALGLNYWTLHKRLRQTMTPAISDDLLGRVMRWQAQQRKAA